MPRLTKDQSKEKTNIKEKKVVKKSIKKETKEPSKKVATKKTTTKKVNKEPVKKATTKKATTKEEAKETTKKVTVKKTSTKKVAKEPVKKATTKKTTTKKVTKEPVKKTTSKKTTNKKEAKGTVKKVTTKKATTKKVTKKTTTTKKASSKKKVTKVELSLIEYYDLPISYDQTVVKVLYQDPTTLFVYWEISDNDRENFKSKYGEDFFEKTKPVLIIHNDTMNYSYEIDINDYANSWYFDINDSQCDYRVELGRRSINNNEYIYISSSNEIESPNDKILFNTNEGNNVYFKNIKTTNIKKVDLQEIIDKLNLRNSKFNYPLIKNIVDLYSNIYKVNNPGEIYATSNPSSGNTTSGMF